jgi:hypothetical protein
MPVNPASSTSKITRSNASAALRAMAKVRLV